MYISMYISMSTNLQYSFMKGWRDRYGRWMCAYSPSTSSTTTMKCEFPTTKGGVDKLCLYQGVNGEGEGGMVLVCRLVKRPFRDRRKSEWPLILYIYESGDA